MTNQRRKFLRKTAVEHYFKPGCYAALYEDWIDGRLDDSDADIDIDEDVIALYELLVEVTEPDHTIAEATRTYVSTLGDIALDAALKMLIQAVTGKP